MIMVRLILGFLKGAAIGAAIGYGAYLLGLGGAWCYLTFAVVGLLVGMLVGRPLWSHLLDKKSTVWASVLKGLFGVLLAEGVTLLVRKVAHDPSLSFAGERHSLTGWSYLFGGAFGALYGAWIEVDDAPAHVEPGLDRDPPVRRKKK